MANSFTGDLSRLVLALEELQTSVSPTGPEGRLIFSSGEGCAQAALLREIDQTVLRRRLSFSNDRNECCVLVVSERQIERGEVAGGSEPVVDASGLRKLLAAFAVGSGRIWVRSDIMGEGGFGGAPGVSVQDILAGQAPDVATDLCREVFQVCSGIAMSVVVVAAQAPPATSGAADWCEKLTALAGDLEHGQNDRIAGASSDRLTIWHTASSAGVSIARVSMDARSLWIAFDGAQLEGLMTALSAKFSF